MNIDELELKVLTYEKEIQSIGEKKRELKEMQLEAHVQMEKCMIEIERIKEEKRLSEKFGQDVQIITTDGIKSSEEVSVPNV